MANGRIPTSQLAPIPGTSPRRGGKPLMRKDAARAYTALHNYSMKRYGISMAISEGSIRRAYRELAAQQAAYRSMPRGMAAYPGTSNHGLGLAIDLMNRQQRWVIDQCGHLFGFSKRWSDAAHEWWHVKFKPGVYAMVKKWATASDPVLRYKMSGPSVKRLQKLLRAKGYKSVAVTGYFGVATRKAVWRFQRKRGLPTDGVAGPSTWRALRR